VELTVATVVGEAVQVMVWPEIALPPESLGVAVSWPVPPAVRVAVAGVTVTVATTASPGPVEVGEDPQAARAARAKSQARR
jgi:hypothetical protein